ncbi:MAG: FtsX-like permease family protein [Candidatus Altiarchaeales archaeon]|nr:FtsX-like permease family protein [Candidatus Altiarchaeales archaeon]MBD3417104.1 FtsX-like permease family protein [Candidatus Altiarchaeales archaeon]
MIAEYVGFALHSLSSRGLRSWLTMLGIFVGIAAVVALISLGQGLQNYINEEFEKVGANRIIITPGGGGGGVIAMGSSDLTSAKLRDSDLDTVLDVRGVESGAGLARKTLDVVFKDEAKSVYVFGGDYGKDSLEYLKTVDYMVVEEGRYLSSSDKYKALVGKPLALEGFEHEIKRGDKITIKDIDFEVVGFTKKAGNPPHDNKVVVPVDTLRDLYDMEDELAMISVRVMDGFNVSEVADNVERKLRRSHGLKEGDEDFTVQTSQQLLESFNAILGIVQAFLAGIAAISLVVGGLGIMTTMYTSVLERTRQIGIMKAVGARNTNILMLFLVEAGILGMVGGLIGVALGLTISFGSSYVAENYFNNDLLKASAEPALIFGALAFSFIVGCLSGLLPSMKAARMRPVDAIRYR